MVVTYTKPGGWKTGPLGCATSPIWPIEEVIELCLLFLAQGAVKLLRDWHYPFYVHKRNFETLLYGAGFTRTIEGTYTPAFFVSGVFCVVAGILCLFIGGSRNTKESGLRRGRRCNTVIRGDGRP